MVREIVARIERSEIRGRWLPHFAALNAGYEAAHFGETNPTNPTRVVPAHSASLRAFTPVFDGLWTRVNALMLGTHNHGLWLWVPALRPLRWRRPGRRSFMRTKHQPAAVGNDRRLRSLVSGLLFTMDGATPTCRAVSVCSAAHRWAVSNRARIEVMAGGRGGGRGREVRAASTSRWPAYRGEAITRGPRAPARHVAMTRDEPWASEEVE